MVQDLARQLERSCRLADNSIKVGLGQEARVAVRQLLFDIKQRIDFALPRETVYADDPASPRRQFEPAPPPPPSDLLGRLAAPAV